jgi:D-alanyl-D-alanine carboxypeptidase (penicillin-binding protein 5/6)
MLKRSFVFVFCCVLLLNFLLLPAGRSRAGLPEISAEAAVVLDWNSGRPLYSKNHHLPRPMASTTKIMTALVALEKGSLEDVVITSARSAQTGGSSIWLEEGEKKTLEELLLGLMLRSGNDAAVAIAEHISGSVESFAQLMTQRAKELGAQNTVFRNPHGLHHPEHYTTAYDMARIAAHAMGMKEFRRIISTPSARISWPGHPWDRFLYNQNKLFDLYPGAEGIKTGWTTPAGRCFVGAAQDNNRRLISVVLNAPQMWEDTVLLLDFGFQSYNFTSLVSKGQYLKSAAVSNGVSEKVKVIAAESFYYPLKNTEEKKVTYRFIINEPLKAPLRNKERIGEMEIYFGKEVVGVVDLLAGQEIKKIGFWERWQKKLGRRE